MDFLKIIADRTPAQYVRLLSNPSMIPVRLAAPRSSSVSEIVNWLFPELPGSELTELRRQLLLNHSFFAAVNRETVLRRDRHFRLGRIPELLYLLVRVARPDLFLETGVFDGVSSAVILQAMEDNENGRLVSIDLPAVEAIEGSTHRMSETRLPAGVGPGWVIPEALRDRHELILGDTFDLLPGVCNGADIDIFMHDSLHTDECMRFEYETVWPCVRAGGLLTSDDIFWSPAFHRFCAEKDLPYRQVDAFGVARKSLASGRA